MNKIKQYYDKLILAFLLIVFIISLVLQLSYIEDSAKPLSNTAKEEINRLSADYEGVDSSLLLIVDNMRAAKPWMRSESRSVIPSEVYSDLMAVPEVARCEKCLGLIFFNDYEKKKCSLCNAAINKGVITERDRDSDKDGIPDEVEKLLGLDPKNPVDAAGDLDADTFSNLEEYKLCKASADYSSITDPKKHPSLICYLSLKKIEERPLNIKLTSISTSGSADASQWRIFLTVDGKSVRTSVNKSFVSEGVTYTIERARNDPPPSNPYGKAVARLRLTIEGRTDKVVVEQNKEVLDPKPTVILDYNMDGTVREIKTTVGGKFSIGNDHVGMEEIELISADNAKNVCQVKSAVTDQTESVGADQSRSPGGAAVSSPGVPSDNAAAPAAATSIDDFLK